MDIFKELNYDLQIKVYLHYAIERRRKERLYKKKKNIIRLLRNIYLVTTNCKSTDIISLMQSCGTIMATSNIITYYEYWSIEDWTLWEFIIYVKNILVERRLILEDILLNDTNLTKYNDGVYGKIQITDYIKLWNNIHAKYMMKIPFNYGEYRN